jgi:hypothetical protein
MSAPAVTNTAARGTIEAVQAAQYQHELHAQNTLVAIHVAQTATVIVEQQAANAVAAQQTATAIAEQQAANAAAAQQTATAIAVQYTVQAANAQATATKEAQAATATARAWQATQQAQFTAATATAESVHATATVEMVVFNSQATATKAADNAIATVQVARARKEELDAQIEELVYPLKAYGPWVLLLIAVVAIVFGLYRFAVVMEARQRVIQSEGSKNVIVLDPSGKVLQPHSALGPILDPRQRILPPTADEQLIVTENAQRITAIRATHPPQDSGRSDNRTTRQHRYREAAGAMLRPQLQRHDKPPTPGLRQIYDLRTLKHAYQAGLLTPQMAQALETDWQQQIIDGECLEV